MKKIGLFLILLLAGLGLLDASYLTWEHANQILPPCSVHWWVDCGKVLQSQYSTVLGVPLAVFGILQYGLLIILVSNLFFTWRTKISWWLLTQALIGFLFSLYFVSLQLFVIQAICLYCMASAGISTFIFFLALSIVKKKRRFVLWVLAIVYQQVLKRIFFLTNPEIVHTLMVRFGELLGKLPLVKNLLKILFNPHYPQLSQTVSGLEFPTPIGLAAGFDYEARLTQTLHSFGFSFQTVGTITAQPCEGNARPRLGRLPKSKALLVNKGFRNLGAKNTIHKLNKQTFTNHVGVSIGQTNTDKFTSLAEVIEDILKSFRMFEKSGSKHTYYELNISCPNLHSSFNFYSPNNLHQLLTHIDALKIRRPLFVKMPISESNETVIELLTVISKHSPVGIIIGNLQKNRMDPAVVPSERENLGKGNLSGKPTFNRSNELIALAYRKFGKKLFIIGCGGVFSAEDAYLKICLGASLVQLITGMIFQGPQLIAQINDGLTELMAADGFTSLTQAIGSKNATYSHTSSELHQQKRYTKKKER